MKECEFNPSYLFIIGFTKSLRAIAVQTCFAGLIFDCKVYVGTKPLQLIITREVDCVNGGFVRTQTIFFQPMKKLHTR